MSDRENNVYKAELAQEAERYDDTIDAMKKVVSLGVELTVDERDLLSVAYKKMIDARRDTWDIIYKQESEVEGEKLEMIQAYRAQVEMEGKEICYDILDLLDEHLIPRATSGESKVFYLTMKGDYHRYLAEFATGVDRKDATEDSLVAYKAASDIAMEELGPTHPTRLWLALKFAVFYHDILNSTDQACRLAKEAYDGATADDPEGTYHPWGCPLWMLQYNLRDWTEESQAQDSDLQEEEQEEPAQQEQEEEPEQESMFLKILKIFRM